MKKLVTFINVCQKIFFKNENKSILLLFFVISIAAFVWSYFSGYLTSYADATSHLNIARRLIDNKDIGFSQLGSSWLPLLHLLLFPFIINDFLYRSGVAGYLVNVIPFLCANWFLYKILQSFFKERSLYPLLFTLLFALNPNVLYMQTTAMGEILLLFAMLGSVYFLNRFFVNLRDFASFIISSIFVLLATLNRYEGWFFALVQTILVFSFMLVKKNLKNAEGKTIMFGTLAFFGIYVWILYNATIFGDPLNFLHDQYTAKGQQDVLWKAGLLLTKDNLLLSLITYTLASISVVGITFFIITGIALVASLFKKSFMDIKFWLILCLLSPFIFETYTLVKGITAIYVLELSPHKLFNTRYGIFIYPGVIAMIAYFLASFRSKLVHIVVIILLLLQLIFLYTKLPITLVDPLIDFRKEASQSQVIAAEYLQNHYNGGNILLAAGALDPIIFYSHIDIKEYIHEGNGDLWNASLANPYNHAEFIVRSKGGSLQLARDVLSNELVKHPELLSNYKVVYDKGVVMIYQRN